MKVAIYGCGRVGNAIAQYFPEAVKITSQTPQKAELVRDCDWCILALRGKVEYSKGFGAYQTRMQELDENKPRVEEFVQNARNSNAGIIVVTNPVDLFVKYIDEQLPNQVFPFGLELDSMRFSAYLGRPVEVVGIHGKSLPVLGRDNEKEYQKIIDKVDKKILESFWKNGVNYELLAKVFYEFFQTLPKQKEAPNLNEIETRLLEKIMAEFDALYKKHFTSPQASPS